jgi:hypothetical protein
MLSCSNKQKKEMLTGAMNANSELEKFRKKMRKNQSKFREKIK